MKELLLSITDEVVGVLKVKKFGNHCSRAVNILIKTIHYWLTFDILGQNEFLAI